MAGLRVVARGLVQVLGDGGGGGRAAAAVWRRGHADQVMSGG